VVSSRQEVIFILEHLAYGLISAVQELPGMELGMIEVTPCFVRGSGDAERAGPAPAVAQTIVAAR
jgi:hypothetical protein